jgi:hypothetical protein
MEVFQNLKSPKVLHRLLWSFDTTLHWNTRVFLYMGRDGTGLSHSNAWPGTASVVYVTLLMMNVGCLGTTLRQSSSHFSERLQLHHWRKHKFGAMSNQCWFVVLTLKAIIPHTPYSLDLAPCEVFLFLKMKLKLKGRHFNSIEEIHTKSKTLTQNDF